MYLWILVIAYFPNSYWAFPFHLQNREHDVFQNVSMWALDSKGIKYLGTYGNYLICEDTALMATFAYIRKCFNNCSDELSYNEAYFTGIYGIGSKQLSLNPRQRQCQSKSGKFKSLLRKQKIIRHAISKREIKHRHKHAKVRAKRAVRTKKWSQLVVKLLIVIDYALYSLLGKDFEFIAQYMNIFWSAVDLKYRQISQPKISFQISGVLIAKEPNILDYVDDFKFSFLDKDTLDVSESLDNFLNIRKHLVDIDVPNYHSIVTISGLQGWSDEDIIYGLAFQKGVCSAHKNAAIVIDDGQYFGVHNAVHELGHLLGLDHDGVDEIIEDEFGYYNCTDQSNTSGKHYIMFERNKLSHDDVLWSNCSLQYFNLLESDEAVRCAGIPYKR